MVEFNIGKNQGITQAIRDKIGAANIKHSDLKTWQSVVSLVDSAKQNDSIFQKQGRNGNVFTTDKTKINDKKTYQSNYVVNEGKVTIDDGIWTKITKLLTGSDFESNGEKFELEDNATKVKAGIEKSLDVNLIQNTVDPDTKLTIDTQGTDVPAMATGKQLTRSVNGQKQVIEILQDKDGNKVRYAVNSDGTRGEELVTVSTTGKNTYQTKSEFDKTVRNTLGLKDGQNLPDNLKPFYIEIGGSPQLMFKSDNGTLTPKQAADYCKQHIAQGTGEYDGKSMKEIANTVAKNLDYSRLAESFIKTALEKDGVQLNYGGKMYTVQQGNLVDAQGNKFNVQGNKLVPVKTSQEPVQTFTKQGELNYDVSDSSSGLYTKRGQLDYE